MNDAGSILGLLAVAGILTFWLVISNKYDRARIRENVEASGGKIVSIEKQIFGGFGRRRGTAYEVTYTTRQGKLIKATCVTSVMSGVSWLSNRPPGSDAENFLEPEPIECLHCGTKIPAGKIRCPQCGWSYKEPAS